MLTTGLSWAHQHHQQLLLCGSTTAAAAATTTGTCCSNLFMMAMMRRPPVRCQALADSMLASARAGKGLAMTQRDLGASRQCGDIPTETLSLDSDFVVINKVRMNMLDTGTDTTTSDRILLERDYSSIEACCRLQQ